MAEKSPDHRTSEVITTKLIWLWNNACKREFLLLGYTLKKNINTCTHTHWLLVMHAPKHRTQRCLPAMLLLLCQQLWQVPLIKLNAVDEHMHSQVATIDNEVICVWHLASHVTPLSFLDENVGEVKTWSWSLITRPIYWATSSLVTISTCSSIVWSFKSLGTIIGFQSAAWCAVSFLCNGSICWDSRCTTISVDLLFGVFWVFFLHSHIFSHMNIEVLNAFELEIISLKQSSS